MLARVQHPHLCSGPSTGDEKQPRRSLALGGVDAAPRPPGSGCWGWRQTPLWGWVGAAGAREQVRAVTRPRWGQSDKCGPFGREDWEGC